MAVNDFLPEARAVARIFHAFPAVPMWQKASAAVFVYCKCIFMKKRQF